MFSLISPPITTVWPSYTVTSVVTSRVEKTGLLMMFCGHDKMSVQ